LIHIQNVPSRNNPSQNGPSHNVPSLNVPSPNSPEHETTHHKTSHHQMTQVTKHPITKCPRKSNIWKIYQDSDLWKDPGNGKLKNKTLHCTLVQLFRKGLLVLVQPFFHNYYKLSANVCNMLLTYLKWYHGYVVLVSWYCCQDNIIT
jgi:hypothetical protein